MSMNELFNTDVKTWSNLKINSLKLNNPGVTGITGSTTLDTYYTNNVTVTTSNAASISLPLQLTRIGCISNITWDTFDFTATSDGTLDFVIPVGYKSPNTTTSFVTTIIYAAVPYISPIVVNGDTVSLFGGTNPFASGQPYTIYGYSITYYSS